MGAFISTESSYFSASPITSGITSLLRLTNILLLMNTPFLAISSILLRVAREMVAPASSTGCNTAIGVTLPLLPTCQMTSSSIVEASCASNLNAIAHFGNLFVQPISSRGATLFILITIPSISTSRLFFILSTFSISFIISFSSLQILK